MTGKCVRRLSIGTAFRSSVLRVDGSNVRMPALAEDHLVVAALEDVLRRLQVLVNRRAHAALEQHRPAQSPDFLEQRVVLHVARPDLQQVGHGDDGRQLPRIHHLGDDRQPGDFARAYASRSRPSVLSPWKL